MGVIGLGYKEIQDRCQEVSEKHNSSLSLASFISPPGRFIYKDQTNVTFQQERPGTLCFA